MPQWQKMNKTIQYQGKKIVYQLKGKGNPLLLIHGFGEDGTVWNKQVAYLADNFQIIIPDLPGSGQSEMIEDMSMEGMAAILHHIIQKEKIDPCVMIGHSMGGYITLAFAEKYPDLLSAFGLFHSSAYADNEEKKATRRKGIEFIKQHGAFEFLKTATPNLFSQQSKDEKQALITAHVKSLSSFSDDALVSYYEAMIARPERTAQLVNTNIPVLFTIGKYDNAIPFEDSMQQCHLPEKSYIHILSQSGHMGMLEEPEKCNIFLEKFLNDIPSYFHQLN